MNDLSLRLHQLARALDERFVPYVHREGLDTREDGRVQMLRSRALTAMAASMVARIPAQDAAERVTDYFHDDGIDGFAVAEPDSDSPVIYLIQSKWSEKGNYSLGVQTALQLVEGLTKLQERDLSSGNRLMDHQPEIDAVMTRPGTRVVLVFATSGKSDVSPTTREQVESAVRRRAGRDLQVDCRYLTLKDFVHELEAGLARRDVDVSASLIGNRTVVDHDFALQGTISAAELGQWYLSHGATLFDDNVRVAMDSDVNREMIDCLLREPEHFWYFNTGVTALCERWQRAPVIASSVPYQFFGLRVVDGAQTVSSIAKAMKIDRDSVERARVPVRFIALEEKGPRFGSRIAYATNRVNPMRPRDMLAMDYIQQRLRDDFKLTWGQEYAIRAADEQPSADQGYSVLEAVIAMACGKCDVAELISVKNDIESLWRTQDELYRRMFNDRTSVMEVRRRARALRLVRAELEDGVSLTSERAKTVAILGDLVIASIVFRWLGDEGIGDPSSDWDRRLDQIAGHVGYAGRALRALNSRVNGKLESDLTAKDDCRRVARILRNSGWLSGQVRDIIGLRPETVALNGEITEVRSWESEPEFHLPIKGKRGAYGRRCDGGFLVSAGSYMAKLDQSSLSTPQLRHRRNLQASLGVADVLDGFFVLTRDALFESPSQAASVLLAHSVNGADGWVTADGRSYNRVVRDENEGR